MLGRRQSATSASTCAVPLQRSGHIEPLASSQWKKEESQNCIFRFARPPPGPVQTVDSGAQPIDYFRFFFLMKQLTY